MNDPSQAVTKLSLLLEEETRYVAELTGALQAERHSLSRTDRDGLIAVIAEKQRIIDALNDADKARARFLTAAGYAADHHGLEAFIEGQAGPHRARLRDAWRRLLDAVSECRHKNLVNGSIIGMNLRHCADAVAVLSGRDPGQELYDPRGNTSSAPPRRRGSPVKA